MQCRKRKTFEQIALQNSILDIMRSAYFLKAFEDRIHDGDRVKLLVGKNIETCRLN